MPRCAPRVDRTINGVPGRVGATALALALALAAAMPRRAAAQTYTVDSITAWSIGTVAAASSGATVFLNSADGYVNIISGAGQTVKGPLAYQTVSIRCVDSGGNLCSNANNYARIRVGRTGVNTGRAQTITTIGVYNGTGTIGSGTNETNSTVDVTFSGWTASNQVKTFRVSCYWPINGDDGSGSTGSASSQFYVYAAKNPTVPTTGTTGTITATVRRALALTKSSDLRFGTVIAPASGSFQVTLSNSDGSRVASPGSYAGNLVPSGYGPAAYAITGEPGTTFSLTYPSSFSMTGPATLTVNLVGTVASGSQTVPGGGTLALTLGANTTIASGQRSGNYSGTFAVTLAYN